MQEYYDTLEAAKSDLEAQGYRALASGYWIKRSAADDSQRSFSTPSLLTLVTHAGPEGTYYAPRFA